MFHLTSERGGSASKSLSASSKIEQHHLPCLKPGAQVSCVRWGWGGVRWALILWSKVNEEPECPVWSPYQKEPQLIPYQKCQWRRDKHLNKGDKIFLGQSSLMLHWSKAIPSINLVLVLPLLIKWVCIVKLRSVRHFLFLSFLPTVVYYN